MRPDGILLVPHEGDPFGILEPGHCGAMPPTAWLHHGRWGRVVTRGTPSKTGLVVQWQSDPVPEGLDRLWWRCRSASRWKHPAIDHYRVPSRVLLEDCWKVWEVGAIVYIDRDGKAIDP